MLLVGLAEYTSEVWAVGNADSSRSEIVGSTERSVVPAMLTGSLDGLKMTVRGEAPNVR